VPDQTRTVLVLVHAPLDTLVLALLLLQRGSLVLVGFVRWLRELWLGRLGARARGDVVAVAEDVGHSVGLGGWGGVSVVVVCLGFVGVGVVRVRVEWVDMVMVVMVMRMVRASSFHLLGWVGAQLIVAVISKVLGRWCEMRVLCIWSVGLVVMVMVVIMVVAFVVGWC
jgi:hypothetical protein